MDLMGPVVQGRMEVLSWNACSTGPVPQCRSSVPLDLKGPVIYGRSGSAVKKRLLRRAGSAAAIFGLTMAVAHIGPTTLWIAVVKVAVALGIFAERWRCPAGQRWRPWSSRPRSLAASPDAFRHCGWSGRRTYSGVLFRSAVTSAPSPPGTFSPGSAQARSRAVMRRPGSRWSGAVERPSAFRPGICQVGADRASVVRCRRSLLVAVGRCCCCHRCCHPRDATAPGYLPRPAVVLVRRPFPHRTDCWRSTRQREGVKGGFACT